MPLIKTYEMNEATGELAKLYEEVIKERGEVMNSHKLFSSSPELLRQQLDFIKYYIRHSSLSMPLLASIRLLISSKENCKFCIDFNTAMLVNMFGWNLEQVQDMQQDIAKANLPKKELAMLEFTIKAIKNANTINANDIDNLHKLEWSDKDILDALNHASRMLSTDIIFNTFKIDNYK